MAQRPESGSPVKPARGFPWRLWLYAIVVTGAAGAGGYFTWQYRQQAQHGDADHADCAKNLTALRGQAADATQQATECKASLAAATQKATGLEQQSGEVAKSLNATKDELAQLRAQKAEADKRMAAIEDIQEQFAKMIDTGQLQVVARHGALVVSLPAEVLFPSGSSVLSKRGEYAVVEVAGVLKKFPDRRYLVVGHTDNQDFAKSKTPEPCAPKDNWQLSTERALTVTRVMVTAGMPSKNLIPAGEGEHDPIAPNTTAQGRQNNRRIEIALLPAIDELPPLPASLQDAAGSGSGSGAK
ncbi:MAG: OmpA family protein [Kofleriaceae bacterium]